MIANGWSSTAVFTALRAKYPDDVTDRELTDIIAWSEKQSLSPSVLLLGNRPNFKIQPKPVKQRSPLEHAQWWLSGLTMDREPFVVLSQLPIPNVRPVALSLALEMLWLGTDNLNIVCQFLEEGGKAKPHGPGRILSRDKWIEYLNAKGVPESKAGAWIRPNPCKPQGSGTAGAVNDSDIVAWRYLLVESDVLPLSVQLALFNRLKLPISAVIMSGGVSAHAWVRLDAKSEESFSDSARRILAALAPFGIDQANKNPSRLSRLPSAHRIIGGVDGGMQSLLWLNPARPAITSDDIAAFEDSLLIPAIEEKPFKRMVKEALVRYEELTANKGKIGIQTGFADFDRDTGGLMPGQMSVVAGETNSGKSTVALNIINGALSNGHGVALFTLEMSHEEIVDMMFSVNCRIDRNHFNTAEWTELEMSAMVRNLKPLSELPLWIYDESMMTADAIRKRILALKSENKIKLAVVDYCQIVSATGGDNREQEVSQIARTLCSIAKDAKIALVVLSQLNDDRKLRESRVIGHEAHNIFLLENKETENKMIFKVVKGRRIQKKDYELYYDAIHCRIASLSYADSP